MSIVERKIIASFIVLVLLGTASALTATFSVSKLDTESGTKLILNASNSTGNITSYSWNVTESGQEEYTGSGQTDQTTALEDGSYTVKLTVSNSTDTSISSQPVSISGEGGEEGGGEGPGPGGENQQSRNYSFQNAATSNYAVPAILNDTAVLKNTNNTTEYNVTNATGHNLITNQTGSSNTTLFDLSGEPDGRYTVHASTGKTYTFDKLDGQTADIKGRIQYPNSTAVNTDVDVHYFLNTTRFKRITATTLPGINGSERFYTVSTPRSKAWVGVPDNRSTYKKYKNKTSILDHNLTVNLTNVSASVFTSDGTPYTNGALELQRLSGQESQQRIPFMKTPFTVQTTTNSTGGFTAQVPKGTGNEGNAYDVQVVDDSYGQVNNQGFGGDITATGVDDLSQINITKHTGWITGNISLAEADKWGILLRKSGRQSSSTHIIPGTEAGEYNITNVPNGSYSAGVYKFSVNPLDIEGTTQPVRVRPDQANVIGESGVTLNGTVTASGSPVDEARIRVYNRSARRYYNTETDSNGVYSLSVQDATSYNVRVQPPFDSSLSGTSKLTSVSGDTTQNFTLGTGENLTVNVQPAGTKAFLFVHTQDYTYTSSTEQAVTNNTFSGLSSGTNHRVEAFAQDFGKDCEETTITAGSTTSVNITCSGQNASLSGTVLNKTKTGVNATVKASSFELNKAYTADAVNGTYNLSNLPSGAFYRLEFDPDSTYSSVTKYKFLDSDATLNVTVQNTAQIKGYVTASGNDLQGADVYTFNDSVSSFDWDTTDSDGYYELDVSGVDHEIRARHPDYSFYENTTSTGTHNISYGTSYSLNGTINLKNSNKTPTGYVSIENTSRSSEAYVTLNGSDFTATGLKGGPHNVYVSIDDTDYQPKTTQVNLSNTSDVNITVSSSGRPLRVTVKDTTGSDVDNTTIYTDVTQQTTGANSSSATLGKYTGNVSVTATKPGYQGTTTTVTMNTSTSNQFGTVQLTSKQNETVTIEQRNPIKVDVNVTKNGNDLASTPVTMINTNNSISKVSTDVTDTAGSATLRDLVNGTYRVVFPEAPGSIYSNTTPISSGATGTVNAGPVKADYSVTNDTIIN